MASKQIRGKISVGRRRRKDGTRRDGRQTDGRTVIWKRFTEEPSLRKTIPPLLPVPYREEEKEGELGRDGREGGGIN